MDPDGVFKEIRFFFHNGICLRKDVIKLIVEKLQKLRKLLLTEQKLNLFSCSLLILYDGSISRNRPETTSHLADTKHCQNTTDTNMTELYFESNKISANSIRANHTGSEVCPKTTETRAHPTGASHIGYPMNPESGETSVGPIDVNQTGNKPNLETSDICTNFVGKSQTEVEVRADIREVNAGQISVVQVPNGLANDKTQSHVDVRNANVDIDKGNTGIINDRDSTKFDVRLIDFAHVSEKNVNELMKLDQDDSIAFGLTKLIDILQSMLRT